MGLFVREGEMFVVDGLMPSGVRVCVCVFM